VYFLGLHSLAEEEENGGGRRQEEEEKRMAHKWTHQRVKWSFYMSI
jgi:hypothetical protein